MTLTANAAPISRSRRNVLAAAASIAVASGMPVWTWAVTVPSAPSPGAAALKVPGDFMELSRLLIPDTKLDQRIAARLYAALIAQDGGFVRQAQALLEFARAARIGAVEALATAAQDDAAHMATLGKIISAWYLGVVGGDVGGTLVTFELALMHRQVQDAVVAPTYCRAAPGYWVKPPPRA